MRRRHAFAQIVRNVADGSKICISRLRTTLEMRCLRNLTRAKDAYAKSPFFLLGHFHVLASPERASG
jgi:hypothetical protein